MALAIAVVSVVSAAAAAAATAAGPIDAASVAALWSFVAPLWTAVVALRG